MTPEQWKAGVRAATYRTHGMTLDGKPGIPVRLLSWSKTGVRARIEGRVETFHPDDLHVNA